MAERRSVETGAPAEDVSAAAVPSPWPANASFRPDGMWIAEQSAVALAGRYGTPLLVFDRSDLVARLRSAKRAFPKMFYAVKAFSAHADAPAGRRRGARPARRERRRGRRVHARRGRARPDRLHGRNKSDDELKLAIRARVGLLIADGLDELRRVDALAGVAGVVQPFLLRVNPGVLVDTHESIATGHESTAFGVPAAVASATIAASSSLANVRFLGLHAHIGSQVPTSEPFMRELDVLVALAATLREDHGIAVEMLDMGGGFAITYTDERRPFIADIAAAAERRLRVPCGELGLPVPTLAAEPGRSIAGNPGISLYRVGDRRTLGDGRTVIAVDGGMSDNIRPMLYDARYTVALASRAGGPASATMSIVGRHCESGDVLADAVTLPSDVERGDLLAFAATGAYTYPLASTYNRVGRPAVVAVDEGQASVWVRREGSGDLDRLEAPAPRKAPDADPPDGITLRPAAPEDARSFLSFWKAIVGEGGYVRSEEVDTPARVYRARFRRSWTDREAQIMALDAGRVVGHVYIQREAHPVTRHVATLGIAVSADRRGQGIGRALMAEAFRWARSSGVEKIMLSVYPHNHAAIGLYRRFGFVEEGRLVAHSRKSTGYEDEILMSAWITEGPGPW